MNYWVLPDTHFDHEACETEAFCNRPKGFEMKILKGLRVIKEEDVLIHLGDIAFHNHKKWQEELKKFPFKKWLVIGNHDSKSKTWYLANGWDFVCKTFQLDIYGEVITFSHRPILDMPIGLNIHGHFHNASIDTIVTAEPEMAYCFTERHLLVAIEDYNYQPVNLKGLIQKYGNKNKKN